jgi:hypothetical protein
MSALRQSLDRLNAWQLVALAGILAGIPFVAVFLAAMATINTYLVPEIQLRTETVSHLVDTDLERALGLGIPLGKLVGVMPYLEEVIRQNPGLDFVAIADSDHKVLYGMAVEGKRRLLHPIAEDTDAASLDKGRGQEIVLVSTPLGSGSRGAAGGMLLVGADAVPPQSVYAGLESKLLIGFFIAFFACYELLAYCAGRAVAVPAEKVDALLDRLAAGDLRQTERVSAEGRLGRLLTTLNRLVRVLHDRVVEFQIYAEEVRQSTLDPARKQRVGALARQVEAGLQLPERAPQLRPEDDNRPLDRFVLFLLAASAAALLPGLAYRPDAPSAAATLVPLAGCFAGLILAGRTLRPWFRNTGRAVPAGFALVLAGLGAAATTLTAPDIPSLFAVELVLGSAIGLIAGYHAGAERAQTGRLAALAEMPRASLLSGSVCGIGLADLYARFDDGAAILLPAFGLLALAALASWLGAPRGRSDDRRMGWPSPTEILAGFGRWRIALTALGLMALPRALAALLLIVSLPVLAGTDVMAAAILPALLLASFAYYPALTLASAFPATIRPLAVLARLAMAAGALLACLATGFPAEIGGYLAAFAFGVTLPIDDQVARQAGLHDAEIGPRRAVLLSHLAIGIAVPAVLVAASFMPPEKSPWLPIGLAGALLLAALIQAGLGLAGPKRVGKLPEAGL